MKTHIFNTIFNTIVYINNKILETVKKYTIIILYDQQQIQENYLEFEARVHEQFDEAIQCLERRRSYLMDTIKLERDRKQRTFKEQVLYLVI